MIQQFLFYITSRCNLACGSCFYRSHLNQCQDWTHKEIDLIASQLPEVKSILLTGGEPFMRTDLMDVLDTITCHHPSVALNINTNGTFPKRIEKVVRGYLRRYQNLFGISISLDGKRDVHNKIRARNAYDPALDSIHRLSHIKARCPELYFAVNSLLTPETIDELLELIAMLADNFRLDYHNVELVRGNGAPADRIPAEKLRSFFNAYLKIIKARYPAAYELSRARFELQYNGYVHKAPWGYPCHAGSGSVVLYPDGKLAACEMRAPLLNLKDYAYDLSAALQSDPMQAEVKRIQKAHCTCTHGCWLLTSMFEYLDRRYGSREYARIPDDTEHRSLAEIR